MLPPFIRQYLPMGLSLAAWFVLTALIGSELRQIFQPLGMGFVAFLFFAAFSGVGLALIYLVLSPRQKCPECAKPLPRFRRPVSLDQALWGGWECPHCHAHVGLVGRKLRAMRGKH